MEDLWHVILLVVSFIAVLAAAYFITRFLGTRMGQGTGSKYLKVVDRIMLGYDKAICLVQLGDRFYMVGITNHHIECLAELNDNDLIPLETRPVAFYGLLDKYMMNYNKSEAKGQRSSIDKIKEKLEQRKEKYRNF